eukprot:GEMP01013418.1.p1 GENE.GEMP01013418.1~~GEMP01013418.1.p1  ORF type:complete len:356 (+),score=74.74 GEMP01013418.1:1120-2187(+)
MYEGVDDIFVTSPLFVEIDDFFVSDGSKYHARGLCKPCAFFYKLDPNNGTVSGGCDNGRRCHFCHACPPGEKKRRRKEFHARESFRKDSGATDLTQFTQTTCEEGTNIESYPSTTSSLYQSGECGEDQFGFPEEIAEIPLRGELDSNDESLSFPKDARKQSHLSLRTANQEEEYREARPSTARPSTARPSTTLSSDQGDNDQSLDDEAQLGLLLGAWESLRSCSQGPPIDPKELPSIGSRKHYELRCRPCAFFHRDPQGCANGKQCSWCHLCPPDENRRLKKFFAGKKNSNRRSVLFRLCDTDDDENLLALMSATSNDRDCQSTSTPDASNNVKSDRLGSVCTSAEDGENPKAIH